MKTIQIPENELKEMQLFYQEEYEKTMARLEHITTALKRLGVEIHDKAAQESKKPGRKKPGRKSKWELIIMKRMRQLDKPVTYDQLTDEIMAYTKIPSGKRTSTKQAVVNVIFRLRNRDQKLDTFSMGTREKYIALKGWFDTQGKIKREYANKVDIPGRKTKPRKVGRPRKLKE